MFGSLFDLATNVVKVVAAPVEIITDIVSVPVKIAADAATEVVKEVKSLKDL
jgi:hypothetical protein